MEKMVCHSESIRNIEGHSEATKRLFSIATYHQVPPPHTHIPDQFALISSKPTSKIEWKEETVQLTYPHGLHQGQPNHAFQGKALIIKIGLSQNILVPEAAHNLKEATQTLFPGC